MMAVRKATDSGSIAVQRLKDRILKDTGLNIAGLTLDHAVRLADKAGFSLYLVCIQGSRP